MARGFTGEPVPPGMINGAMTNANVHLDLALHIDESVSR
jgi:hypothetical protein